MSIVLFRIDERLIHGQVVMGWGPELRPEHFVVADDELAASEWEQNLYRLGLPEAATADFLTVSDAADRLEQFDSDPRSTIVLTRTVAVMVGLARGGALQEREVNIGGVHHAPGRTERLPYVFLDPEDEAHLKALDDAGAKVTARDLPSTRPVGLATLLR